MFIKIIILNVIVSIATSYFFGRKYKIGFWYSLLFCLLFGFLIGNIIMLLSPLKTKNITYKKTTGIQYLKAGVSVVGAIICYLISNSYAKQIEGYKRTTAFDFQPYLFDNRIAGDSQLRLLFILWAIGFVVLAIYCLDGEAKPKEVISA